MNEHIETLIATLKQHYPDLSFSTDTTFFWSPNDKSVHFDAEALDKEESVWALLHEVGHALLEHTKYYSDIQLVQMELEAWEEAKKISAQFKITINPDHIEDCLDSYRDWLYKRSLCPDCQLCGVQVSSKTYMCVFCSLKWSVTTERFCRPYRRAIV